MQSYVTVCGDFNLFDLENNEWLTLIITKPAKTDETDESVCGSVIGTSPWNTAVSEHLLHFKPPSVFILRLLLHFQTQMQIRSYSFKKKNALTHITLRAAGDSRYTVAQLQISLQILRLCCTLNLYSLTPIQRQKYFYAKIIALCLA